MKTRIVKIIATLVLIVLPWSSGSAQTLPTLRVGATANDTYAEAYYAQEQGFFAKAGLNVELSTMNNGAALAAAIAAGTLDVGVSTPIQIAQAVSRGVPFMLVAAGAINTVRTPAAVICVAKSSPFRGAKDFEGASVAVNALRTSSEELLDAWLAKNGADLSKVHTVEMGFSEMGAALKRGTIAAAVISEPALSAALHSHAIKVFANPTGAIADQFLLSAWFTTRQFEAANPALMARFASAIYAAARWANGHHDDSAAILAKYAKVDVDAVRAMTRAPYAYALRVGDLQPQLDAGLKFGLLQRAVAGRELLR